MQQTPTPEPHIDSAIRLVIVDGHEEVRLGLGLMLEGEPDISVVGLVGSIEEATRLVSEVRPNVALLDLKLPDGSGIDLCRRLTNDWPDLKCVLHLGTAEEGIISAARRAGAFAVVLKSLSGSDLLDAIRLGYDRNEASSR